MKRVLIHSCCAHCAAYTIEHWRKEGYEVSALWYNPNIHPYTEHQKRLEAMQTLAGEMKVPLINTGGYDIVDAKRPIDARPQTPAELLAINGIDIVADPGETYTFLMDLYESGEFTFERLEAWMRRSVQG